MTIVPDQGIVSKIESPCKGKWRAAWHRLPEFLKNGCTARSGPKARVSLIHLDEVERYTMHSTDLPYQYRHAGTILHLQYVRNHRRASWLSVDVSSE